MIRHDSRAPKELRKITIETNVFKHPEAFGGYFVW